MMSAEIPANAANYKKGRRGVDYIVVHYTANNGDTARGNALYFSKNAVGSSAHYFVDEKEIYKSVDEADTAWHCGGRAISGTEHKLFGLCTNSSSIGVELCSRKNPGGYYFKEETVENAVILIKQLMKRYNLPPERVIRHYDVTGKKCPAPFVDNAAWAKFKEKLSEDDEMTTEEKNRLVALEEKVAHLGSEKIYHYVNELPDWAKPSIEKLRARGIFSGESDAELNLPETLMRMLVINDRAGIYDR